MAAAAETPRWRINKAPPLIAGPGGLLRRLPHGIMPRLTSVTRPNLLLSLAALRLSAADSTSTMTKHRRQAHS